MRPICLPLLGEEDADLDGFKMVATGWGKTNDGNITKDIFSFSALLDYSSCPKTIICLLHRLQNKSRVKQVECYCSRKQEVQRELRRHYQRNEHMRYRYGRSRNVPGIRTLFNLYQMLILYYLVN